MTVQVFLDIEYLLKGKFCNLTDRKLQKGGIKFCYLKFATDGSLKFILIDFSIANLC